MRLSLFHTLLPQLRVALFRYGPDLSHCRVEIRAGQLSLVLRAMLEIATELAVMQMACSGY
jgi:hypothetical protein